MNKKIAAIISIVLIAIIGVFSIGMKKEKNTGADNEATSTVVVTDANGEKVETKIYPCCKRGIFSLHGCALHVEIRGEAYASPFF